MNCVWLRQYGINVKYGKLGIRCPHSSGGRVEGQPALLVPWESLPSCHPAASLYGLSDNPPRF